MDANSQEAVPLLMRERDASGNETLFCLGWHEPELIRPMFTRKEATFEYVVFADGQMTAKIAVSRKHQGARRAAILVAATPALLKARALSSAGATQALSTTYEEDLYPDSPEQIAHKRENGIPLTVTGSVMSLKKYRQKKLRDGSAIDIGFMPWGDNDRFARRRFDPDRLKPQFRTVRAAMAALAAAKATGNA